MRSYRGRHRHRRVRFEGISKSIGSRLFGYEMYVNLATLHDSESGEALLASVLAREEFLVTAARNGIDTALVRRLWATLDSIFVRRSEAA